MENSNQNTTGTNLAWAVLSLGKDTGRSEVIKITNHSEADQYVQSDPGLYYKSGPFVLN